MTEKKRKQDLTIDQLEEVFETRLTSSFRPVNPDQYFVDNLKDRLVHPSETSLERTVDPLRLLLTVSSILAFIGTMLFLGISLQRLLFSQRRLSKG